MKNEQRITWVSGPATGFFIDFENQTIGYSDKEESINRLQTRLLFFMLSSPGGFVTDKEIAMDPEIFSISLSRYISDIKKKIVSLFRSSGEEGQADLVFEQIIEKRKTYGNTGYRLRTELTDILDEVTSETPGTATLEAVEDESVSDPMPLGFKRYLKYNWMPLFLYFFLVLGVILLLDSLHISAESLLAKITGIPFGFTFMILAVLASLPVIGGVLIDVPMAVKEYERKKGVKRKDLDANAIHEIAMRIVPRFDNSKEHVIFFLICNLTGAFTAASVLLYNKSIPGLPEYLSTAGRDYAYIIVYVAGCLVALFNNYSLQTSDSPTRCADDFILTRAHAFLNLIYLSVCLALGGSLIYTFLSYRFFYNNGAVVITPAYIVMILSAYCYLWFSSDSPSARKIDSISKNNFITGLPIAAAITTVYTVLCFTPNLICVLSLLTAPVFLILWLVCFLRRRKENTLKLYYFVSSFFSVMAISVIVMLILNFWW